MKPAAVPGPKPQRGYALLLMLVLLTMGLLFSVVSEVSLVGAKYARTQNTSAVLVEAKEALLGYALTYRDTHTDEVFGYLPCPDMDGDGSADTSDADCGGTDGKAVIGLLPYKELGLSSNLDSDGNCLWYAVSGTFKASSHKPTPMNWDTPGQIEVRDANNNVIAQLNDKGTPLDISDDIEGRAAAVIFSVGPPIGTQEHIPVTSTDTCGISQTQKASTNYRKYIEVDLAGTDIALSQPFPGPANGTVRVTEGSATSTVNNDRVAFVTPKEIFNRIVARTDFRNLATATPSGQINALSKSIQLTIEKQIQRDLLAPGAQSPPSLIALPNQTGYTQFGTAKLVGDTAATLALTPNQSDINYLANWRNQYRYAVCSDLSSPCLDIAGTSCRAALMMGGRSTTGGPRTSAQNTSTTANLDYFFEAGKGREMLNSISSTFTGNTSYYSPTTSQSEDIATCLFPGSFVSFAKNIASFSAGVSNAGTAGTTLTAVDTSANTITLGTSSATGGGVGCVWDTTAIETKSLLRLFLRVNFASKGNGFTIAMADGATNQIPNDAARTQVMCGAQGSTTMGYAGIPPADSSGTPAAGTTAGIKSPKLGIEFDPRYGSSRGDPLTDHIAFVYWGDATDNGISGSGANDNTHYLGYGGFAITNISWVNKVSVSNASWAAGTVTITTNVPHGFSVGQNIPVLGISPTAYNGLVTIASTPSSTKFTYSLASSPGNFIQIGTPTAGGAVLTTASPHGFSNGEAVLTSGINPSTYNGIYSIATSSTLPKNLGIVLASTPGPFVSGGMVKATSTGVAPRNPRVATALGAVSVTGATWTIVNGGSVRITTSSAHGLNIGQKVYLTGITPAGYNGVYTVSSLPSICRTTCFRFLLASNPGAYVSGGSLPANEAEVSALSWSAGTAHATTPLSHGFTTGQTVSIAGVTPSDFNTSGALTSIDATHFDYSFGTDPSGTFSTETPAGMFLTKNSSAAPYKYLRYSSIPTGTTINVRLDISRSYDTTRHIAVLNMKAYIGDTFGSPILDGDICSSASDFQDMTEDVSSLCPLRTVTMQQDSIPINALATLSGASWSSGLVTATTSAAHGLVDGAKITLSGTTPSAYNGTYTITVTGANTFTYTLASNPGTWTSGGDVEPLTRIYFGFTNSRSGSSATSASEDQSITIDQLLLRGQ